MYLNELIATIENLNKEIPFDCHLTDSEFSPFNDYLSGMKLEDGKLRIIFSEEEGLRSSEALNIINTLVSESNLNTSEIKVVTDRHDEEVLKVYHDAPVTIIEMEYDYYSRNRGEM